MDAFAQSDEQRLLDALKFVKVTVGEGAGSLSGYLTDISSKMLIAELNHRGFEVVERVVR